MRVWVERSDCLVAPTEVPLPLDKGLGSAAFNLTCGAAGTAVLSYELSEAAALRFIPPTASRVSVHKAAFGSSFHFEDFGIGGLDRELQTIIR